MGLNFSVFKFPYTNCYDIIFFHLPMSGLYRKLLYPGIFMKEIESKLTNIRQLDLVTKINWAAMYRVSLI